MKLSRLFKECINIPYLKLGASANYAVEILGNSLHIFFEASDGIEDWKSNLDFPAKAYKRSGKTVWYAHRGFLDVWKDLESAVSKYILDKSITKITTVGYSHGAAIAFLCHEYISYHRPEIKDRTSGYGFGCPRVFWGIPSDSLKERWNNFLVIRNTDDIVTHLPPAFLGYRHVSRILTIGSAGKYSRIEAHRSENILKELIIYENNKHF